MLDKEKPCMPGDEATSKVLTTSSKWCLNVQTLFTLIECKLKIISFFNFCAVSGKGHQSLHCLLSRVPISNSAVYGYEVIMSNDEVIYEAILCKIHSVQETLSELTGTR